jgi:hypothetical protein
MKKAIVLAFVCLLAIAAVAGEKSITFVSPTTLNGKAIAPGDYKVSYDIKGSTADVKISQNGKTVATATGEVVQKVDVPTRNAVVNQKNADGTNTVVEFQFAKEKQVIRLAPEASAVGK